MVSKAKSLKRVLITVVKFLISIAILSWLFSKAWQENQFQSLVQADKNWGGLILAFIACLAAHMISFFRWQLFVQAIDLPFKFLDAVRIGFIGSFFNLLSLGVIGGDALRAYYVTRQVKHRVTEAVASVVLDRFIGLLTMFSVAAMAFLCWEPSELEMVSENYRAIRIIGAIVLSGSAAGFCFLLSMIFMPKLTKTRLFAWIVTLPLIGNALLQVTKVIRVYRSKPRLIFFGFVLSLGVNLCFVIAIYLIADSITKAHPSFVDHFLIEPISMVANAVPLPGGIGGMELVLDYLYRSFTVEAAEGFGFIVALGFRFLLLIVSAFGAIVWFFNRNQIKQDLGDRWKA
jgi:uncharacterized protein (TIRG00374 family)